MDLSNLTPSTQFETAHELHFLGLQGWSSKPADTQSQNIWNKTQAQLGLEATDLYVDFKVDGSRITEFFYTIDDAGNPQFRFQKFSDTVDHFQRDDVGRLVRDNFGTPLIDSKAPQDCVSVIDLDQNGQIEGGDRFIDTSGQMFLVNDAGTDNGEGMISLGTYTRQINTAQLPIIARHYQAHIKTAIPHRYELNQDGIDQIIFDNDRNGNLDANDYLIIDGAFYHVKSDMDEKGNLKLEYNASLSQFETDAPLQHIQSAKVMAANN